MYVDEHILTQFVIESNAIEGIPARSGMYHDVHLDAARAIVSHYEDFLLFDDSMMKLHELLGPVLDPDVRVGRFRNNEASVWHRAFPAARHVPSLMAWFHTRLTIFSALPQPVGTELSLKAWHVHHDFVCIHPFADGNGRVARLLLNAVRLNLGLPWQIVYEQKQSAYFRAIRQYEDSIFRPGNAWAYDAA